MFSLVPMAGFESSRYNHRQYADILGFSSDFSLLFQLSLSFNNRNTFNIFDQYEADFTRILPKPTTRTFLS
jgi:hypothetical protein